MLIVFIYLASTNDHMNSTYLNYQLLQYVCPLSGYMYVHMQIHVHVSMSMSHVHVFVQCISMSHVHMFVQCMCTYMYMHEHEYVCISMSHVLYMCLYNACAHTCLIQYSV